MIASRRRTLTAALALACLAGGAEEVLAKRKKAQAEEKPDPFAAKVEGLEQRRGLLDLYLDRKEGRIWLEVPPAGGADGSIGEFLYVEGLVTGLGSNPVGLDRGQIGETIVVVLRRLGGRVLIEQPNLRFRALSESAAETAAARQSFAPSVRWAGKIEAQAADGRGLVDLTSFLVRDAHGVSRRLARQKQGKYELDAERSAIDFAACHVFPDNLEFEALLTFAAREPGEEVTRTAPSSESFTLVQHHSLIRLPDSAGYRPRAFDPRAGSFAVSFHDYAAPLDAPLEKRWIVRHRLRRSPEAEPELVYYVDRGIPEPVRSAVVEGASWWAEAFAEAGFGDAYRVELLPAEAHPLDVRYNVIQWVHRSTRGWSYGGGVVDPRTGERIKGHISLGSLRVRQDRLIFEGLLGADGSGSGAADDPVQLALARIRQLSAHEVGHGLGLAHNFAASTYGRASVMDYPAPLVLPAAGGGLDVGAAYAVGVGEWDRYAIRYAYAELAEADEAEGLARMVGDALDRGLVMLTDPDARPPGAALAGASLWDNGADPVAQLELEMEVRRRALAAFGERNVARGQPLALLEETLAPLYYRHRYQLAATVKAVGGVDYRYAVRGDGQPPPAPVDADGQRRALAAVLATLDPAALDLPDSVLAALHPRPFGYPPNRELFRGAGGAVFDPLAAAGTAADLAIAGLLQPQRAARLVDQHRRSAELPGFEEILEALVGTAFAPSENGRAAEIGRAVQAVLVQRLIALGGDPEAAVAVRARAEAALEDLADRLSGEADERAETAHRRFLRREIERQLARSSPPAPAARAARAAPPGDPIGAGWGDCSLGSTHFGEEER